jgi:hypothetical protein
MLNKGTFESGKYTRALHGMVAVAQLTKKHLALNTGCDHNRLPLGSILSHPGLHILPL